MRYFLYTYSLAEDFDISRRAGVFGARKDGAGLESKFWNLQRGDLIIIRDGRKKPLSFFGCCRVSGNVFDHGEYSPFVDLLWRDEQAEQRVIYPLRAAVDFIDVPKLKLDAVTWLALDALGISGTNGLIEGRRAWVKKFSGNFIELPAEVEAFSKLLNLQQGSVPAPSEAAA